MNDPLSVLAHLIPQARSEDELAMMAARMAPPPPMGFTSQTIPPTQGGVAQVAAPMGGGRGGTLLGQPQQPPMIPPMTQGAARTRPDLGQVLLGA